MIESIPRDASPVPKARAVCDECGRGEVVTCVYERKVSGNRGSRQGHGSRVPNEAQVMSKLFGWRSFKGVLRCPKCEAQRKISQGAKKMAEPAKVMELRTPTREQRRVILELLAVSYDTKAERYKGVDTDKTIAETIGGGCMPGWVAELREEFFGPDGANDDMATLMAELTKWQTDMDAKAAELHTLITKSTADLRAFNEGRGKAAEFMRRLEAIKVAVGPKAARI